MALLEEAGDLLLDAFAAPVGESVSPERVLDLSGRIARSPVGVPHPVPAGVAEELVPDVQGRPDGGAGVMGRRLHEQAGEGALFEDALVGEAIQGDAARQAQVPLPGPAVQMFRHVADDLIRPPL